MHNKKPTASRTGSRTKTLCAGILAAAALGGIFLGARYLDNRMNTTAIESDSYQAMYSEHNNSSYVRGSLNLYGEKYTYDHNFENYLFIGTDNSGTDEELKSPEETWQNGMADYLMLFTIDKTADTYAIIELNRDTMTTVHQILKDGTGESTGIQQLCTANWYGGTPELGSKNQIRAVSDLLGGLKINGYYSMDMDDIANINAAIGGVTVTLEEDFTHLDPQMKKGKTLKLTDQQAYYYLHNRMDVGDGTNEGRMARQHQYLTNFLEQGMSQMSTNPQYFYGVLETMDTFAKTNLTGKQISRIAKAMTENEFLGVLTFDGTSNLGQSLSDGLDHAEFTVDESSVAEIMTTVYSLTDAGAAPVKELEEEIETEEYDDEATTEVYDFSDEDMTE